MATVTVTPAPGVLVRKESGGLLAAAGEDLPVTPWWIRRANDGDVSLADPTPAVEAKPKK